MHQRMKLTLVHRMYHSVTFSTCKYCVGVCAVPLQRKGEGLGKKLLDFGKDSQIAWMNMPCS